MKIGYKDFILLLLCILTIGISNLCSQDLLINDKNDTMAIIVVELKSKHLVYHKVDDEAKRLYTTPYKKLIGILYENGETLDFASEAIRKKEIKKELQNSDSFLTSKDDFFGTSFWFGKDRVKGRELIQLYEDAESYESIRLYRSGRTKNGIGNILGLATGYIFGRQLYAVLTNYKSANKPIFVASGLLGIISISLNVNGRKRMKKSAKLYNDKIQIKFEGSPGGLGMTFNF